jgi:hypothetical protein
VVRGPFEKAPAARVRYSGGRGTHMSKWRIGAAGGLVLVVVLAFVTAVLGSDAQMYFALDKNGQNRVTNIQEGDSIWICIYDPDENIDCDLRDKIWTDVKIMDQKTGAYIVWETYSSCTLGSPDGYKGKSGCTTVGDYLEETGADTGLFVSNHAFQVGTREDYALDYKNTHIVGPYHHSVSLTLTDFKWGHYEYVDPEPLSTKDKKNVDGDTRGWFGVDDPPPAANLVFKEGLMSPTLTHAFLPSELTSGAGSIADGWLVGRFENMDTLVGMYQDPNDDKDVAVTMGKIVDTEATISWDREIYKDARGAATITVTDPDENLDCNRVEYVPVFILVNPGSWNPVNSGSLPTSSTGDSPNNFCQLKRTGGIAGNDKTTLSAAVDPGDDRSIRWYSIYNALKNDYGTVTAGAEDGRYYIQYPVKAVPSVNWWENVTYFDTVSANGVTAVSFYAQETGPNTGVFELRLNNILDDLGFKSLDVRDVLVAYYLDPNDEDDFKLATAYIEEHQHSITNFTDATRNSKRLFWIGRDPVYVQVIDSNASVDPCCPEQVVVHICDPHEEDDVEWWILDESSSNSPVFFSNAGMQLLPVWDALGLGLVSGTGGYQLELDNWKLEVFNEDSVFVRYNDVYYTDNAVGMHGLGDADTTTAFSGPRIDRVRVENDVSFDLMEIADTQVFDGTSTKMYFLDRQGNRVSGYVNSDCVFIEVIDPDQDEDQYRRERVDAYWDGGQNIPFGPVDVNDWNCGPVGTQTHSVNALLGDTNIFNDSPHQVLVTGALAPKGDNTNGDHLMGPDRGWAKVYVLNPRNGRWAATDILETGVATADFVSVICIDLVAVYTCVPTLGVLPGDTIIAAYQDPSNHSDSSWISIKVGIGGGGTPPGQASSTAFTDAEGNIVTSYTDADSVYVKVIDPSHAGAASLADAVEIGTATFDLAPLSGAATDTFITAAITMTELGVGAGDSITATYKDPTDPTDTSSDTISIIASELSVEEFIAKPNPFADETVFTYVGSGIATTFSVEVYDLSGHLVWSEELANVSEVAWDGTNEAGAALANGAYIYVVMATDGTNTFTGKGVVFIHR